MITVPFVWQVSVLMTVAAFALAQEARLTGAAQVQPFVVVMVVAQAYLGFARLTRDGGVNWRGALLVSGAPVVLVQWQSAFARTQTASGNAILKPPGQPGRPPLCNQASAVRMASSVCARSRRAARAAFMSTLTKRVGVWGCNWPIRSMSAEMTVPIMK